MRFTALLVAAIAAMCVLTPAAFAGNTVGSFEIDGNLADDGGSGEPIDWSTPPPNLTSFTDPSGHSDDVFGQGKELEPGSWQCAAGFAPAKDDLVSGQIAFRRLETANGPKQFAYMNYRRLGVNGEAHIDVEFNKSSMANAACPDVKARTPGDVVISFDTGNGGKDFFVHAYEWTGFGFTELPIGSKGSSFDGAVNIPNTIPGHTAGDFGEAAVNLTDTIGEIACGEFSSAYMKTRSSSAVNADLKDRTQARPLDVGSCPESVLAKAVRNVTADGSFATAATAAPGDTIEYRLVYTNTGDGAATNVAISDLIPARSTFQACSASCSTDGSPVTKVEWSLGTVPAGESRTVTFSVALDETFPSGTTPVDNTAAVATREEGATPSNRTTVDVTGAPVSELAKAVRNVSDDGTFAASAVAKPGDTVEYRLTYTNTGTADATGVTVSDPIPARTRFASCTDGCAADGPPVANVEWSLGTVAPGGSRTVTFRVTLDPTFPAGATDVDNVGTADSSEDVATRSDKASVTVTAAPKLALVKSVDATRGEVADAITYTLEYSNAGNAPAAAVRIDETIPEGTRFVSCTGGCTTEGSPTTEAAWTVSDVSPGSKGTVTLTVEVLNSVGCMICNTAAISSPSQGDGAAIPSNEVCIPAVPGGDPWNAHANKGALSVTVVDGALGIDQTHGRVASSQTGPGSDSRSADLPHLMVPPNDGSLVRAGELRTTSRSTINQLRHRAEHTSTSEAFAVNILKGLVTADVVRAVSITHASGWGSSWSPSGSTIKGLKVQGLAVSNSAPGQRIQLPATLFGANSYVALYERQGTTETPPYGTVSEGRYAADLTVNMIRVHITDRDPLVGGAQALDITVASSDAHTDFPRKVLCSGNPRQSVSGDAVVASEHTNPDGVAVQSGNVQISTTGGRDRQQLEHLALGQNGSVLTTGLAESESYGTMSPDNSTASSYAQAADVCALAGEAGCMIRATAVRAQANSRAVATTRSSNANGTTFAGLVVGGTTVPLPVNPNTVIALPELGYVVLNEQVADAPATGRTGLTVRAIHAVVTVPGNALRLAPGAEVVIAEAHSGAIYVP